MSLHDHKSVSLVFAPTHPSPSTSSDIRPGPPRLGRPLSMDFHIKHPSYKYPLSGSLQSPSLNYCQAPRIYLSIIYIMFFAVLQGSASKLSCPWLINKRTRRTFDFDGRRAMAGLDGSLRMNQVTV